MGKLSRPSATAANKAKKTGQLSLDRFFAKTQISTDVQPKPEANECAAVTNEKKKKKRKEEETSDSEKAVKQCTKLKDQPIIGLHMKQLHGTDDLKKKPINTTVDSIKSGDDQQAIPSGNEQMVSTDIIDDQRYSQTTVIPNTPEPNSTPSESTPKNSQGGSLYPTHIVPETPTSQMKASRFAFRRCQAHHEHGRKSQIQMLDQNVVEIVNDHEKENKEKFLRSLHVEKEFSLSSVENINDFDEKNKSEIVQERLQVEMVNEVFIENELGKENKLDVVEKSVDEMKPLSSASINKNSINGRGMKLSRSYKKAIRLQTAPVKVTDDVIEESEENSKNKRLSCNFNVNNVIDSTNVCSNETLNSNLSDDDFLNAGLEDIFQKHSQKKELHCSRSKSKMQKMTKRKHGQSKPEVYVKEAGASIKPFRPHLKRSSTRGISPNEKRKPSSSRRNPFAKNGVSGTCIKTLFSGKRFEDGSSYIEVDGLSLKESSNEDEVDRLSVTKSRKPEGLSVVEDITADDLSLLNESYVGDVNGMCENSRTIIMGDASGAVAKQRQQDLKTPTKKINTGQDMLSPATKAFLESMDNSWLEEEEEVCMMSQNSDGCTDLQKSFSALSPFKSPSTQSNQQPEYPDLNRYIVMQVVEEQFEKVVHVRSELDNSLKVCRLKGTWGQTPLQEGMVVAIHGSFDESNHIVITQNVNFIVVKPDILLTGTAIAGSIRCKRRSVLRERFKGADFSNKAMLCGTILHEIFEMAISKKTFTREFIEMTAKEVLMMPAIMNDMFRISLSDQDVLDVVDEYIGPITAWAKKYHCSTPKTSSCVEVKFPNEMKPSKSYMCVSDLKDIEENVCSPRWGIKGKVDLTVEVKIHREKPHHKQQTLILPLELKTGRETNSMEHRSQLLLYSFLLSELGCSRELGFLLYLKTGSMISVPATHMDKRELISLRNHLAYYITQTPSKGENEEGWSLPVLPEPIQDTFSCTRCSELHHCALLHRLESNPVVLKENIASCYQEKLEHLNEDELRYFREWFLMCMLEHTAAEERKINSQMWKVDPWKRERRDQCYSGMLLVNCKPGERLGQYLLTFKRKPSHPSNKPLSTVQMATGQRLAVTKEKTKEVALCVGFIVEITSDAIVIATDRELRMRGKAAVYRLDKDDSYNSMASSLVNLANLMKNEPTSSHIRQLIMNAEQPIFQHAPISLPDNVQAKVNEILTDLNQDQRSVIDKVLRSNDYTLVVGMPGTGKTTSIVALARVLMYHGLSVLLTSYTHSAIDNILLKLCEHEVEFLRLGRSLSIHPDIQSYSEEVIAKQAKNIEEITQIYKTVPIVATTCLGAKHAIFSQRRFDVCIVDEASQISQPVCLGPLLLANRFVLVGDHHQLPPLVQSKHARTLGMDESLFKRLATTQPNATVSLTLQYRMNLDIMKLSNVLVYEGALQCGSEEVARSRLTLSKWDDFRNMYQEGKQPHWLLKLLDPNSTVQFLNMDDVPVETSSSTNQTEASVLLKLVDGLLKCGCKGEAIGLVSPYRNQCLLLESMLPSLAIDTSKVEVNTIDKYQGRDKQVIIVSFVKVSTQGELLQDIRRLNVALTRAKSKLLLIGSYKALNGYDPLRNLLIHLKQQQLIIPYAS